MKILTNQVERLAEITAELTELNSALRKYSAREAELLEKGDSSEAGLRAIVEAQLKAKPLPALIRRREQESEALMAAMLPVLAGEKTKFRKRIQARRDAEIGRLAAAINGFVSNKRLAHQHAQEIAATGQGIFHQLKKASGAGAETLTDDIGQRLAVVRRFMAEVERAERELDLPKAA